MSFSFSAANAGASGVSFISGGKILYSKYGVASRDTIAGKLAAWNHDTHGFATTIPSSSASFKHNRFCAAAVRKRALELLPACQETKEHNSYVFSRRHNSYVVRNAG